MQPSKLDFSNDVMRIVYKVCQLAFNLHSEQDIQRVFGMTYKEMEAVIQQIAAAMPDAIFHLSAQRLEEIKNICAREFVFFQVQEKCDDPQYQHDLTSFIQFFTRDIEQNTNPELTEAKDERGGR